MTNAALYTILMEVGVVTESDASRDCCDAPGLMISAQEQMQLVTIAQEPPGKICADESARTCQDDALHLLNEMLVIEDFKILMSVKSYLFPLMR